VKKCSEQKTRGGEIEYAKKKRDRSRGIKRCILKKKRCIERKEKHIGK